MSAPLRPSLAEFRALAERGNLVPVYTELIADAETPVAAFHKLDEGGYSFLLESAETSDHVGRFSFVGSSPRIIFQSRGRNIRVVENGESREFQCERDPLESLRELMSRFQAALDADTAALPFAGGAIGYMSYDTVRFFEPSIGEPKTDALGLPETLFLVADTLLIFDHRLRRLRILANAFVDGDPEKAYREASEKIAHILQRLARPAELPELNIFAEREEVIPASNTRREDYLRIVNEAKEFIRAGDIFQIVPSQRFQAPYAGDALTLYRALRFVNPSPYMFCIKFAGLDCEPFALVGSSPEVHVRAVHNRIEIRPIAGTRPRGRDAAEDEKNADDLKADPKERAEHLMLVDLARNDVGRIAEFGSVRVTDFMTIEKYSHVMHLVSNVVGDLKPGASVYDVMRATFPAGTVSGSPKVRAMQLINQFEQTRRGPYAGAVGYFGFDGNLDSCITLRTVILKNGIAYVQAGGGVVADSTPEGEFDETVNKAKGMMRAIAMARNL